MATEKTRCNGQWTEAKFMSFIKGTLRRASTRWGPKYKALELAYVGKLKNKKTGRMAKHYKCAHCEHLFPAKEVAVDHIHPIMGPEGFVSWDQTVERMFCEVDGLQVLCDGCHTIKSNEERAAAKAWRDKNGST